jgi:hypothetical protein
MRNPASIPIPADPVIRPKLAYPEPEAAAMVGLSARTLFAARQAGRIAFIKIGERVLYRASALRAFLRDHETPAVACEPQELGIS